MYVVGIPKPHTTHNIYMKFTGFENVTITITKSKKLSSVNRSNATPSHESGHSITTRITTISYLMICKTVT
jgi:hypothetical protein